jgi:hypothetical protein
MSSTNPRTPSDEPLAARLQSPKLETSAPATVRMTSAPKTTVENREFSVKTNKPIFENQNSHISHTYSQASWTLQMCLPDVYPPDVHPRRRIPRRRASYIYRRASLTQACTSQDYKICSHIVHTYKVYAHKIHAHEIHAYEVTPTGMGIFVFYFKKRIFSRIKSLFK